MDALYYRAKYCVTLLKIQRRKQQIGLKRYNRGFIDVAVGFWTELTRLLSINKPEGQKSGLPTLPTSSPFYLLTFECFSVRLGALVIFCCCHVERLGTCPLIGASDNGSIRINGSGFGQSIVRLMVQPAHWFNFCWTKPGNQ